MNRPSLKNSESLLTPRESEVKKLKDQRWTNREIATTLQISENTVESHVSNIYRKLREHCDNE